MKFTIEFYVNASGRSLVREFLLELKASDPDDFAAVAFGLGTLRHRR
jgi:hypothetical protein